MNARRCTLLLATASSLVLAGCALKNPPFGADIMPESARAKIPGSWAGPHRSGTVVPNWIRNFGDPELNALVADAVERNPDLKAAAARVEASRAAVRVAASSLYPRIAMKGLGERQGQELSGDSVATSIRRPSGVRERRTAAARDSTPARIHHHSVGYMGIAAGAAWEADVWGRIRSKKAAAKAESYALEADYEFARQSLAAAVARAYIHYHRSRATGSQRTGNTRYLPGVFESSLTCANSRVLRATSTFRKLSRAPPPPRMRSTPHRRRGRRQSAPSRSSPVATPPADLMCDVLSPANREAVPAGMPAQILERRPDLIASERRFAAAFHRVNEARTARLPRFVLSATSGLGTADT